jgi:two-component system chemotaxis sensor kinase CheA
VRITIEDDGAGIDGGRVKARAMARSLISAEQAAAMSDRDALRLIFLPGFSTAEVITELSGRGVGMDVVKTNIARLGGTVDIETNVGLGTTIDIKLPLTLAIMSSLVVRSAAQRFAIPQNSIREIVRIRRADAASRIERIKNALVLRLRGQLLPLVRLGDVLGIPNAEHIETVIVIEVGRLCYGLIVDGVDDAEEIVVKPLGRHLKDCLCFTGAAVLGNGRVALILDVGGIADHAELAKPKGRAGANDRVAHVDEIAQQSVLLFANGSTERFAVPANQVKRIERITADQIESVGGCAVLQYSSCALPLLSLEHFIRAAPRPQCKRLFVVVFEVAGKELGLLAPRIHEIRTVPTKIDTNSFREPGVSGSIVLDGKTVRIVDLPTLAAMADPRRHDPSTTQSADLEPWPTISPLFQDAQQACVPAVVGR